MTIMQYAYMIYLNNQMFSSLKQGNFPNIMYIYILRKEKDWDIPNGFDQITGSFGVY